MEKPKVIKPNPNIIINRQGLSFFSALTIILIIMKIIGYDISWWLIIAAFFGPVIILGIIVIGVLLFFVGCFVVAISIDLYDERQAKKRREANKNRLNGR